MSPSASTRRSGLRRSAPDPSAHRTRRATPAVARKSFRRTVGPSLQIIPIGDGCSGSSGGARFQPPQRRHGARPRFPTHLAPTGPAGADGQLRPGSRWLLTASKAAGPVCCDTPGNGVPVGDPRHGRPILPDRRPGQARAPLRFPEGVRCQHTPARSHHARAGSLPRCAAGIPDLYRQRSARCSSLRSGVSLPRE